MGPLFSRRCPAFLLELLASALLSRPPSLDGGRSGRGNLQGRIPGYSIADQIAGSTEGMAFGHRQGGRSAQLGSNLLGRLPGGHLLPAACRLMQTGRS